MEIIQAERRKETGLSSTYHGRPSAKIPDNFSRAKANQYIVNRSNTGPVSPGPEKDTLKAMYELYVKIGAIDELPSDHDQIDGYLSELWNEVFYDNDLVPADIPGDIVIAEFTRAVVSGLADRKGNNMAAIISAFNKWIVKQDIRERLYKSRDKYYPGQKPKALPPASSFSMDPTEAKQERSVKGKRIEQWPDAALEDTAQKILTIYNDEAGMMAIKSFNVKGQMKRTINEAVKRGLVEVNQRGVKQ
jgi:hypothetical protein